MDPLGIEGVLAVAPLIHRDHRGSFREWFRAGEFAAATGYQFPLAQANFSVSRRGVIRGIHFADIPPGQAKYVTCASGVVLDAVVDIRVGSPTFGEYVIERLDSQTGGALFMPEGLGHAWAPLTTEATLIYLCSEPYNPSGEHAIIPTDPAIGIPWPEWVPIMSMKDSLAPTLAEALEQGMLPSYADCVAR